MLVARSPGDALQVVSEVEPRIRVQIRRWLVEEEDLGVENQCSREGHALGLPPGQFRHGRRQQMRDG